ncbi:GntR family transcriptional regulator [Enterococcus gilvus]|uniref:GntR family transcriptional regulator n=1 Tax=Enterococcus gilvus TaxID=160453 RepID=UPI001C8B8FC5|nr:GntR family transcriptional regulator [Enterococcus gilvus]MBX8938579.1 GntR family transcriptional regulator [Enterococcus gilvus]
MEIDKNSLVPIYEQVMDYIKKKIEKGEWKKGDKISTEKDLMELFDVSRGTIKKAITLLVDEKVLTQKQGKGTFVIDENISFPFAEGLISFSESMKNQGLEFDTKLINLEKKKADKEIARLLKINLGDEYLFIERTRTVHNEVVMFIQNNINIKLAPNIETADYAHESLFNIVEKFSNHKVAYSETSFAAVSSTKTISKLLKIKEDSPLLFQEQLVHLEDDSIIELGRVWLKSNKFYVGSILQRT